MKKSIWWILGAIVVLSSCKKEENSIPSAASDKYMSLSAGSSWNYETTDNILVATKVYTVTSTSRDSSIKGKNYHVFTNNSGGTNEYFNISGNDYYAFRSLPLDAGSTDVENLYLKDNTTTGTNYAQTYNVTLSGFPTTIVATNSITERDIAKTVNGTNYKDVIRVTTTLAVSIGGLPLPSSAIVTDIQAFYA